MCAVTNAARATEREIDGLCQRQALVSRNWEAPLCHLLIAAENQIFLAPEEMTPRQVDAVTDSLINEIRFPIAWLTQHGPFTDKLPLVADSNCYSAAREALSLAHTYKEFVVAYTLGSADVVELDVSHNTLIVDYSRLVADSRYEAYNWLARTPDGVDHTQLVSNLLAEVLLPRITRSSSGFGLRFDPRLVGVAMGFVERVFSSRFELPSSWQFSRYSLSDYRIAARCITALAVCWSMARARCVLEGAPRKASETALITFSRAELSRLVAENTGLTFATAQAIVEDLTYGNRAQVRPDPALQPIMPANAMTLVLSPSLWLGLSWERNFAVLINRLPEERAAYSGLVSEKEKHLRDELVTAAAHLPIRTWWGAVRSPTDATDIDLALIADQEGLIITLELKWFIAPADIREVIERKEELSRGTRQALLAQRLVLGGFASSGLGYDTTRRVQATVVSRGWIGDCTCQDPDVPIISAEHLVAMLNRAKSLTQVADWLRERRYLPVAGEDYDLVQTEWSLGNWRLGWYGFRPLLSGTILSR